MSNIIYDYYAYMVLENNGNILMKGSFRLLIHEEHKYSCMFVLFLICAYFTQGVLQSSTVV